MEEKKESVNYEIYSLQQRINQLEKENEQLKFQNTALVRDIEHLENLSIPMVARELGSSVKRSVKFRVTRAIWGKHNYYQSDVELKEFPDTVTDNETALRALSVICRNDAVNVLDLSREPDARRLALYEAARRMSHIPRRLKRIVRGR